MTCLDLAFTEKNNQKKRDLNSCFETWRTFQYSSRKNWNTLHLTTTLLRCVYDSAYAHTFAGSSLSKLWSFSVCAEFSKPRNFVTPHWCWTSKAHEFHRESSCWLTCWKFTSSNWLLSVNNKLSLWGEDRCHLYIQSWNVFSLQPFMQVNFKDERSL